MSRNRKRKEAESNDKTKISLITDIINRFSLHFFEMESMIPKHHVKQNICATRPSYREGRNPKAVKVYTINNESKYVLIQGVPSVGATKELINLCSSFGKIEEHHALDEYPCEDKYTEVYLIKYERIQSARIAKRKLDDHSFFGGTLHVCYAPEYETVSETRGKLQERRKVIAAKIRQYKNESSERKITHPSIQSEKGLPVSTSNRLLDASDLKKHQSPSETGFQHLQENICSLDNPPFSLSQPESSCMPNKSDSSNLSYPSYTFELPPPPKTSSNMQISHKHKYEFSRVPSKHSTLPSGFDGRLEHNKQKEELQTSIPDAQLPDNTECTSSKKTSSSIHENYQTKPVLKFVPRQAVKRTADESNLDSTNKTSDDLDKEIRKNAFLLVDQQGPVDLPGRSKKFPELTPGASSSYNDTIKSIRNKISKVITDSLTPQRSDK